MGICVQTLAPEAVAHHRDRARLVGWRVQPAERAPDPEHIEEIRARRHRPGPFVTPGRIPIHVAEAGVECDVLKNPGTPEVAVSGGADYVAKPHQPVRPT